MAKTKAQSVIQTDDDTLYYERCAGIDVHKKLLVVCLRIGRKTESREYGTTTGEIREIVKWLQENGCQMAAMESTGSYWKPIYNIFEQEELPAMVVNAYHIKNVPGRKTDWNDAFWIAKCLAQGLLKPSFVPNREQRKFFAHVMNIIREQTRLIEMTDDMIKSSLNDEQKAAVAALDAIPGIGVTSAEQIVAETGTDMSNFRNQHAFSNWIGVAPGNNESAGKRKSGKTTHGNKTLKSTLTQCAKSAVKNKRTFFSAQYSRLVSHRGKNRATMAVAHSMAIAIYFVLSGHAFKDLGADYYTQFNREKKINSHIKQLSKLGVSIPDDVLRSAIAESVA